MNTSNVVYWKQSITDGGFDIMNSVTDIWVGFYLKRWGGQKYCTTPREWGTVHFCCCYHWISYDNCSSLAEVWRIANNSIHLHKPCITNPCAPARVQTNQLHIRHWPPATPSPHPQKKIYSGFQCNGQGFLKDMILIKVPIIFVIKRLPKVQCKWDCPAFHFHTPAALLLQKLISATVC